jgi:hypothetical protein
VNGRVEFIRRVVRKGMKPANRRSRIGPVEVGGIGEHGKEHRGGVDNLGGVGVLRAIS